MRHYILAILMASAVGCQLDRPILSIDEQAVAGPSGVTASSTVSGQASVTWSAEAPAFKYYVYQSVAGGAFAFAASVLSPSTSYSATGLTPGVSYCYKIQAAFPDGTDSDMSAQSCTTAAGGTPCQRIFRTRKFMPFGAGTFQTRDPGFDGAWQPIADSDVLAVDLPVQVGDRIEAVSAFVTNAAAEWSVHMEIKASDNQAASPFTLGAADSLFSGRIIITIPNATQAVPENVDDGVRSYWLRFTARMLSPGDPPRVGPLALITSVSNPSCP